MTSVQKNVSAHSVCDSAQNLQNLHSRRWTQNSNRSFTSNEHSDIPQEPCFGMPYVPASSSISHALVELPQEHNETLQRIMLLADAVQKLCDICRKESPKYRASVDPIEYAFTSFHQLSALLKEHLSFTQINEMNEADSHASCRRALAIASDITLLTEELLNFTERGGKAMVNALGQKSRWPANISSYRNENVAFSSKSISPQAKKKYKLIHSALGKRLHKPQHVEAKNVFHKIASELYFSILQNLCFAQQDRHTGLPWLLDFVCSDGTVRRIRNLSQFDEIQSGKRTLSLIFHNEPTISITKDERNEVIAAMRYYIHLTLSPLPYRKKVQEQWRQCRASLFKHVVKKRHRLKGRKYWVEDSGRISSAPIRFKKRRILCRHLYPDPKFWHRSYLASTLNDIFGDHKPITQWTDDEIIAVKKWKKCSTEHTFFTTCVREILKAFITLTTKHENSETDAATKHKKDASKVGRKPTGTIDLKAAEVKTIHQLTKFTDWKQGLKIPDIAQLLVSHK